MRWKYLVPRILIVALVWGFFALAFDPILRWSLAKTGEKLTGAKVDLAELETTFLPPALELADVQIADQGKPGRNLVEFETFRFQLAPGPLAHRKFVIDEGRVTGLAWNTLRGDSGQLEARDSFEFGEHVPLDGLRNKISELGKAWLQEAIGSAKSQLDPEQLETVKTSKALKDQWLARFQMYENRLTAIEDRVNVLKTGVPADGNALEKIEAYRQAAIDVRKLLEESQRIRQELSQLGPTAGADLQQIELARQRDLENIQEKLDILKLDREALTEGLLGPDVISALEETLEWVHWTKTNVGRLSAAREPARSRGIDVPFHRPEDPHPEFLIRNLLISGTARLDGEMVPYTGTLANITTEPKRLGEPMRVEIRTEGTTEVHFVATIDRTTDVPGYEIFVEHRRPKSAPVRWGDPEKLAFVISGGETVWTARLMLRGEAISGRIAFRQDDVTIEPESGASREPVQVASIEPVRFEWDQRRELQQALSGVFREVDHLEATVEIAGTISDPRWTFSSSLGPQVAEGVESYLAQEIRRRKSHLAGEIERIAGEQIAGFRDVLGERFRDSVSRVNLTESEANQLIQKFAGRSLDVKGFFR